MDCLHAQAAFDKNQQLCLLKPTFACVLVIYLILAPSMIDSERLSFKLFEYKNAWLKLHKYVDCRECFANSKHCMELIETNITQPIRLGWVFTTSWTSSFINTKLTGSSSFFLCDSQIYRIELEGSITSMSSLVPHGDHGADCNVKHQINDLDILFRVSAFVWPTLTRAIILLVEWSCACKKKT